MNPRWHYLMVSVFALIIGALFLREPGFGDDLTYWAQAFDTHEQGAAASIERGSFHDLRWPVWGVAWAIQGMVGFGLSSFYGVPLFYLALGAMVTYAIGRHLLNSAAAGWAAAVAFVFHPLLDSICYRPMPDLSEGVLGAAVMAAWWAMMHAADLHRRLGWAALTGALVYTLESNRVTGVFIVPILIANTLAFFPRRFLWLVGAGAVAALLYAGEMVIYHRLFGDWFHNLHANMNNAGNKGTEPMPVWQFPIRFLDTLWNGNPLAPVYCILTLLGIYQAWRRLGVIGRVVVNWFVLLYLAYGCTPQPVWPIRPLIRDADRFLAGLVVPMSLLAICGLWWLWERVNAVRFVRLPAPALGCIAVLAMWAITTRERFNPGFVPEFRDYLRSLPAGTKVFTHESMRSIAFLSDATSAKQLTFFAPNRILLRTKENEAQAAQCSEFWYARKLVWLTARKQLEKKEMGKQPPLGSFFDDPERDWTLSKLLAKGDTPDLIFYRRRTAETPQPITLTRESAELSGIVPALPAGWSAQSGKRETTTKWAVPESLRGKLARIEIAAHSPQVEPFTLRLKFKRGADEVAEYLLKPYLHREKGKDFFVFTVPKDGDHCDITLKFSAKAKELHVDDVRVVLTTP